MRGCHTLCLRCQPTFVPHSVSGTSIKSVSQPPPMRLLPPTGSKLHHHHGSLPCRGLLGAGKITSACVTGAQECHGVLVAIANTACTDNSSQYQGILASYGYRVHPCSAGHPARSRRGPHAKHHSSELGLCLTTWPTSRQPSSGSAFKCTPPRLAVMLSSLQLWRQESPLTHTCPAGG